MPQLIPLEINDFSGQMNAKVDPSNLAENELVLSENCDFETLGAITKRLGYTLPAIDIPVADDVLGLGVLNKKSGYLRIVAAAGTDAYIYNPTTLVWNAQGLSLTSLDTKVEFKTFLDMLFMANYFDATRTFNGSAWSTTTNVTGAPLGKYLEVFLSRLYIANCKVGSLGYPSRVYYSSLPSNEAITWDTTEGSGNYIEIETDDNDMIRGLIKDPSRLLIFKEFSLHSWDGYSRNPIFGATGTTSHRSIVRINPFIYYFNVDGVYRFDGSNSILVSDPIKPYIDGITNPYNVVAGTKNQHYILYVGTVTNNDAGISLTNAIFDLNTLTGRWKVDVLPVAITAFATMPIGGLSLSS